MAVITKAAVFWDVIPFSVVEVYGLLEEPAAFHKTKLTQKVHCTSSATLYNYPRPYVPYSPHLSEEKLTQPCSLRSRIYLHPFKSVVSSRTPVIIIIIIIIIIKSKGKAHPITGHEGPEVE